MVKPNRKGVNTLATEAANADNRKEDTEIANPLRFTLEPDGEGIELVFGLVAPTGVDLGKVALSLRAQLKTVDYDGVFVRLSELITPYLNGKRENFKNEYRRINTLMEHGTLLREKTNQRDIVGRLGIAGIRSLRKEKTENEKGAQKRTAYIVSSFKRPEEVDLFRQVYGKAFTLISVYSPRQSRIRDLTKRMRSSEPDEGRGSEELAVELIRRDFEEEGRKLGQRLGKTFPLADYFVTADPKPDLDAHLLRLVRLTFGHPYISPSRDEQGMFFARAAALRSLDLSRQVGASVVNKDGELLSTGCNEVPKFGGGLYWAEDEPRARDYELGYDSNVAIKAEILEDVICRLRAQGWLSSNILKETDRDLARNALFGNNRFLDSSLLFDVIEFGRAVHAEAAAVTQAARNGVALEGSRLFCTTFPCHICARHIVASGIKEVVFIEPYEKSRTGELYFDSVSVEPQEPSPSRANFKAFVGVAPRRYMDFFQMGKERKTLQGTVLDMDAIAEHPRIKRLKLTYLIVEDFVIKGTVRSPLNLGEHDER
jgi:deoxycytidylate deaminase